MRVPFKYVSPERDQYGTPRYRFRAPWKRCVMRERDPTSQAFRAEYDRLMSLAPDAPPAPVKHVPARSIAWLIRRYQASPEFRSLDPMTQRQRSHILRHFEDKHGHRPADTMPAAFVRKLVAEKGVDTPAAANQLRKTLRVLFAWGCQDDATRLAANPTLDVRRVRIRSDGFQPWKLTDVRRYIDKHPRGSKAYLALMVFLCTGLRLEDAARFGPSHIVTIDGARWYSLMTSKGDGMLLEAPMHPLLLDAIVATPTIGTKTYLVTDYGKPFTTAGLGNKIRDWRRDAGLPEGLSAHGIRKAMAELLAEQGGTEHEIMAVLAHATPREGATYTKRANRRKLTASAHAKVKDVKI